MSISYTKTLFYKSRPLAKLFLICFIISFTLSKNDMCTSDDFCHEKYNSKYFCNKSDTNCKHEVIVSNPTFWNIIGKQNIKNINSKFLIIFI